MLADDLPIFDIICKRIVKFIVCCLMHCNALVNFITRQSILSQSYLNAVGLCLGETYSSVLLDIDLDYVMCLVSHLILITLLESTVRMVVMIAGWQQHSSC